MEKMDANTITREKATAELRKYLVSKYGTDWNLPNEYWEAAVTMTQRAMELYDSLENLYRVAVVDMTIPDLMYRRKEFDAAESALTKYREQL
jgi:hypothetical protein